MIKEIFYIYDLNKFEKLTLGQAAWGSKITAFKWKKDPDIGFTFLAVELENNTRRCFPERWIMQFVEGD